MLKTKNVLIIALLVVEVVVFGFVYWFGNYGIKQLEKAQKDNQVLQLEVDDLKKGIEKLEKQLQDWELDNFNKEKIARERMHLSRPNEHIYHLV